MSTFLATVQLMLTAARRMLWSRQTMVSLLLLALVSLGCIAWSLRGERTAADFLRQVLLPLYVAFLLPMSCLGYATVGIAGDREEGTLVYLLSTPLPRPLIYAAKFAAALLLTLIWTMGGLWLMGRAAGPAGREAVAVAWPAALLATLAYVSLFQAFGAMFRRATIVALGYALFLEVFLGNMPGIIKRIAITFYTQCLLFDAAAPLGIGPSGPHSTAIFQPVAAPAAQTILVALSVGLLLCGAAVFSRREYP
jgi:ABC-2 type transport system permease protein